MSKKGVRKTPPEWAGPAYHLHKWGKAYWERKGEKAYQYQITLFLQTCDTCGETRRIF